MIGLAARMAARELRGGLAGFRILIACLALGVAAIAGVGTVRSALEAGLTEQGAVLLGGDAEARFTYRYADDTERAWLTEQSTALSEIVDFRSLAVVNDERALTQVKGVDDAYPLTGAVILDPPMPLAEALAPAGSLPGAVMEKALIDRLGLAPGATFRLGTQEFRLTARLVSEPDSGSAGFSLGPRTIVTRSALDGSGLLAPGTLFESRIRLTLPPGSDLGALSQAARKQFADSGLRWRDARRGAPGLATFVDRLSAFLVLIGLSGLAVGGIGVFAAVRSYVSAKTPVIATLKALGAERRLILMTYGMQVGALACVGIILGLVLGAGVPLLAAPWLTEALPLPARFALYPAPLAEAALYGALSAALFMLWPLAQVQKVRPAQLFRDAMSAGRRWPGWTVALLTLALAAALIGTAAIFSEAVTLTLWAAAGLIGALALLALAARGVRVLARRLTPAARGRPALRWALSAIGSPQDREGTRAAILSLGLGLSVLAAIGQIDGNLRSAIDRDLPDVAPSYFFVDIQKDQMPAFTARLDGDPGVSRTESAPMLRGIITRINGKPAREVAGNHWVLQGDRGVTYSAAQPANTTLTEGAWWPKDYTGPPLVSFAAEEGAEMGLSLGDEITVNILGREITTRIASFREVDFSTAGISFIMAMNPGALAGAPHSFIATVYAKEDAEAAILRDLGREMPNITAIAVRDAIGRASGLLAGIASAIRVGAAVTLLTGGLVLIGAAAAGMGARIYEAALLKTLGAARGRILASLALRALLTGLAAGAVALAAGLIAGWAVVRFVMEGDFVVIWPSALGIIAAGIGATLAAALAFAWAPLAARPARVLRARE